MNNSRNKGNSIHSGIGLFGRLRRSPIPVALTGALAVLVVGVLVFVVLYNRVYVRAMRNEAAIQQHRELLSSVNNLDEAMHSVSATVDDAANIPSIRTFTGHVGEYGIYHEIINQLMLLKGYVGRAFSIWVVFADDNLILTSNEGYGQADQFYDRIWTTYDSVNDFLDQEVRISRIRTVSSPAFGPMKMISFMKKVEMYGEDAQNAEAYVLLNMKMDDLIGLLQMRRWSVANTGKELMIVDEKGKNIYDNTGLQGFIPEAEFSRIKDPTVTWSQLKVEETPYLCMAVESTLLPWVFLRFSAYLSQTTGTDLMTKVLIAAMAAGLVLSLLMVLTVYRRIFVPYRRMARRISRDGGMLTEEGYKSDMDYMENIIAKAMTAQERITRSILEHALLFPAAEEETEDTVISGTFVLLMCYIPEDERSYESFLPEQTLLPEELLSGFVGAERLILDYEKMHILPLRGAMAVILEGEMFETERMRSAAERIHSKLEEASSKKCIVAFSSPEKGQWQLHKAWLQIREALAIYYVHPEQQVIGYEDLKRYEMKIYTPNPAMLDMFRNNLNVKSRQFALSREALENIRADVKKNSERSLLTNLRTVQESMFDYLNQAARRLEKDPSVFFDRIGNYEGMTSVPTAEEEFERMDKMIRQLEIACENQPKEQKIEGRTQMVEFAVSYISENYTKGISLTELAGVMGVDETYLSRIFKEKMDCTFVQYVTRLRIKRAKELLLEGEKTQAQIAEEVGMGNAQNFIRTFKKYEGVTPGTWRKEQLRDGSRGRFA